MARDSSSHGPASFSTQANALLRKNLTFQKRNIRSNVRIVTFPILLCVLLAIMQSLIDKKLDNGSNTCGCTCIDSDADGKCEEECGVEHSTVDQARSCPIPSPPKSRPLLQIPAPAYRAVQTDFISYTDLPSESCKKTGSCPAAILLTGSNLTLGQSLGTSMFLSSSTLNASDMLDSMDNNVLGSDSEPPNFNFLSPEMPLYNLQTQCASNSKFSASLPTGSAPSDEETKCVQGLHLWRNSSSEINHELYKGYLKGNPQGKINEIIASYDFLNTARTNFNVTVWYNSTYEDDSSDSPPLLRVPSSINLASNAFLQFLLGHGTKMLFEFVKEMPNPITAFRLNISSLLGGLFYTWVIIQLFPVVLRSLVYEKQQRLRIMMKMHGLSDGPYWMITYAYFLLMSSVYMLVFVKFGAAIGLKFFTLNDYSIQFVFYFFYINLQVSLAFFLAGFFSNVKTATVLGYIMVFGTGLLGAFLFEFLLQDLSFPRGWIIVMELYPGFSLYRGLYEFGQYAFEGDSQGTDGMQWKNLNDSNNGMKEVLIIMFIEWWVVVLVAFYVDQVVSSGRSPTFFMQNFQRKSSSSLQNPSLQRQGSKVVVDMEKPDVLREREKVEQLLLEPSTSHAIVCDDVKKVYPGRDGNPKKFAVRGLSLALPRGECFGMLGPNGAGKTSFINMMIGLLKPTSGTAYVQGLDIRSHMDSIYTSMGVCPQHDLLWETLTGREHLLFYGRLKNLKDAALTQAVDESLKSVNLFHGGVADKQAGKYSGGMKRRLSVAISLIGDPKIVYMDEPSTGLDPASRNSLWNVVKTAKQGRAIILTTHSMEEAEHLCDRLGIFVDGSLQCIGNPKELKARYGGSYVFTMTTSANHEEEVEKLVKHISPHANRIYQISGTQKFELPKHEIKISDVFQAVENAKSRFTVHAWGLADTNLEDVFIKVARGAQAFNVLS